MGDLWHLPAERLIKIPVDRRGWNPFFGAHDVADLHKMIVHHVRQMIGRVTVRFEQHQILKLTVIKRDIAPDDVVNSSRAFLRHHEADDVGRAFGIQAGAFFCRKIAAVAIITGRLLVGFLLFTQRFQAFLGAVAAVRLALADQPVCPLLVQVEPFRLHIRAIFAANLWPLIPVDPQPAQAFGDQVDRILVIPFLVGIFDPQDKCAPVMAGKQPVKQCRADPANMHGSGRAGRESHPNGWVFLCHLFYS